MKAALALALALAVSAAACGDADAAKARALTGGDVARGRTAIRARGCGACHTVPGVAGANGKVGPPLVGLVERSFLAGRVANTPENLVRWIRHPREVDPGTAMPDLGIAEEEARDLAAYLYSVRR